MRQSGIDLEPLGDGLEAAYVGKGVLCLRCGEGAIQPGSVCDVCGLPDVGEGDE